MRGHGGRHPTLKFLKMLLCGNVFLTLAVWVRKITVATQLSGVGLVKNLGGMAEAPRTTANPKPNIETGKLLGENKE